MQTVIKVENLSKKYRLGVLGGGTLSADLNAWRAKKMGKPNPLLKFDEIVDFSDVERYIDTTVKGYSSGMNVQ